MNSRDSYQDVYEEVLGTTYKEKQNERVCKERRKRTCRQESKGKERD